MVEHKIAEALHTHKDLVVLELFNLAVTAPSLCHHCTITAPTLQALIGPAPTEGDHIKWIGAQNSSVCTSCLAKQQQQQQIWQVDGRKQASLYHHCTIRVPSLHRRCTLTPTLTVPTAASRG